ncbi:MAG: glycosyl hydrolase 53 family protein [Oscillospiraceae bacterium]|nr:glycosyl hydrolase 53 family protein [Oscillospiraceae bacterium]
MKAAKKIILFAMLTCAVLSDIVPCSESGLSQVVSGAESDIVEFENFPEWVNGGEPVKGVDISSVLAAENAGVEFFDDKGNSEDIFRILAGHGVNYVRVRVWNSPFDASGRSYGGGNCDMYTAAEIGRRAAKYGMKLLVDLQYSDFWCDPGKQTVPKAWSGYSQEQKKKAIYEYTKKALSVIKEKGADIGMVQIGNETNCFFCGEKDMYKICEMFSEGSRAVRESDKNILVVLHFANPATGYFDWYAKVLDECRVDYDVFAASYYSYWHGSTQNLTDVLQNIAYKYNKFVMVAETAYPYTNEDGDKFSNAVSSGTDNVELKYDISPVGQKQCICDVFRAVANVGDKGIGAFYWEPAWLGRHDNTWEEQNRCWEESGSGWATSYAGEYDSQVIGAGGSSYDNQALFDFYGHPLSSLDVFEDIYPDKPNGVLGKIIENEKKTNDFNENGRIDIYDYVMLRSYALNGVAEPGADVNKDGKVNASDVNSVLRFMLGIQTDNQYNKK